MLDSRRDVPISEAVGQLRALGVEEGGVLLVHTSFRAVRPIERGPGGLIEALILSVGPHGTLVMPSWTGDDDRPFDPAATSAAADLGVVANTFWQLPNVRRSRHPFAFAARGPKAAQIVADPLVLPPHQHRSALGRVLDHDGQVLLLGVNHDANTTLHLAEVMAHVPYGIPHHITVLREGKAARHDYIENDCCCELFVLADAWMQRAGLQSDGIVGHAPAKLMRSQDVICTAFAHLARDPLVFLHPRGSGCEECGQAWQSIPE